MFRIGYLLPYFGNLPKGFDLWLLTCQANPSIDWLIQLILMDIQMPVMNGYDAARKIRGLDDPQKANIPIIAMTANAFTEDRQVALDAGMNDHIAKPINMNVLVPTLRKYL